MRSTRGGGTCLNAPQAEQRHEQSERRTIISETDAFRFYCERCRLTRGAEDEIKKAAFTLAEVLVTLGIIGVVAALTLPMIVENYQKQEMASRLKKAYSIVNQAIKLSEVQNDEYKNWDTDLDPISYLNKYWLPYFSVNTVCTTYSVCGYESNAPWTRYNGGGAYTAFGNDTWRVPFTTSDGMLYSISVNGGTEEASSMIFIDINGAKGPNRFGRDFFMFTRTNAGTIQPFGYDKTDDEVNSDCQKTGECDFCAAKLMREDWKVNSGYPW